MKTQLSYSILKIFLDCFFLFDKNTVNLNKFEAFFCMFQKNRELKQIIKILLFLQKFKNNKATLSPSIVFYVEDLLVKDFLSLLIYKCNLKIKVQIKLLNSVLGESSFINKNTLNIYFIKEKTEKIINLKNKFCSVIFKNNYKFKLNYSGSYLVNQSLFDIKTLIFIVALLNSFFSKNHAKI